MVLLAVIFYTAAISVCEKGRLWQLAVGLWVAMQKSSNLPDISHYTAVISACEKLQTADRPNSISYKLMAVLVRKACSCSRLWDCW